MTQEIKFNGCTYELDDGVFYVIKTRSFGRRSGHLTTYRQRITSAPKIRKLTKLAAEDNAEALRVGREAAAIYMARRA
jgi:hypothetical protein